MRKWILVGAAALASACTQTVPPSSDAGFSDSARAHVPMAVAPQAQPPIPIPLTVVAAEPIRIEPGAKPQRRGAATWWPMRLDSAQLTIAARPQGRLRLRAPDGEVLAFRSTGAWTGDLSGARIWTGRSEGLQPGRAVISFDGSRISGSLDRPSGTTLHLATERDGTWLIEPDPPRAAAAATSAAQSQVDYLMPPAALPADPGVGSAQDERAGADIVVAYTKGFRARFDQPGGGGDYGLALRLDTLFGGINAALSMGINARVRIVHAVQVDYPDDTDDLQALRELTGADGVPAHPAFAEVRRARDAYGGDMVYLVRKYDGPQGGRCGASWMIGGGLTPYARASSGLGYAVFDWDLGRYFCTEYSAAHQFGHALGLQHDRASASPNGTLEYGAFPYAFGYVSGPATDPNAIRTVMAYPVETPQHRSMLSTPERKCYGQVCGVQDQADNRRAARQTFPVLSSFRPKRVPGGSVVGDFDMSGGAELYWRNLASQEFAIWPYAEPSAGRGFFMVAPYDVAAVADFTGDGRSDVLWKSDPDHYLVLWAAQGDGYEQRAIGGFEPGMSFVGVGDFDGDERYDIAWRSHATGELKLWLMRGEQIASTRNATMPGWYEILGIGDFAGDGRSDIVYADSASVNLYMNDGVSFSGARVAGRPAGWTYAGSGDLDSDGRDDMSWINPALGTLSYWRLDGARIVGNPSLRTESYERLAGMRHLFGRSGVELLWDDAAEDAPSGPRYLRMHSPVNDDSRYASYPRGWEIR